MKKILLAGAGLLLSVVAAQAAAITTPPPALIATGDVTAIYVFADAQDTSVLAQSAFGTIFCNHSEGTCVGGTAGQTADLGTLSNPLVFTLDNLSTSTIFTSNAPDGAGDYHALISSNYSVYNEGALPGAAATKINALIAMGETVTYVGWEDLTAAQDSDFDYNDLIFAFANTTTTPPPVPEPMTMSLFGAGLVGAAWINRRKKNKQA